MNRTQLSIVISSLALLIVIIIQMSWITQTAKIKEELFHEKANMVLTRTAEALSADEATCLQMEKSIGEDEIQKTDSLLANYMDNYNFQIPYAFEVCKPGDSTAQTEVVATSNVYSHLLEEEATESGLELKLFLPENRRFMLVEMGPLFIASIVLILIVIIIFWKTTLSLLREKRISEYTTEFLNNMTHEFKTPITNIALATKMMNKSGRANDPEKLDHYSGVILEENNKLSQQVDQMLSLNLLEKGDLPLQKTRLNLHKLLKETTEAFDLRVESRGGHISLELNSSLSEVIGDPSYLATAIRNLIDNAIKYSKEGPVIRITSTDLNGFIVISISDQGIGIDRSMQRKVFEKYFRVPSGDIHNTKGFGLGLALVEKIIEQHSGQITIESDLGKGTTFKIKLPHA